MTVTAVSLVAGRAALFDLNSPAQVADFIENTLWSPVSGADQPRHTQIRR